MLDVLKKHGPITLLTLEPFEPKRIDDYYGTSLSGADIRPVIVKDGLLELLERLKIPHGLVKLHALMRACKEFRRRYSHYDLVCSGYDEQDLVGPCIQYIHYPWNLYPRPDAPPDWNDRWFLQQVILLYNAVCRKFSGFSYQRIYQNLTLVNSRWTGEKSRQRYPELEYLVLNPPAPAPAINDDRSRREARFLSIGRCSPEKEWLKLIDIVESLRDRGHDVGLTLAGSRDSGSYETEVRARKTGDWLELKLDFSREELTEMLLTHQFGLHGMNDEHYGMAVAELILGGCLTSVPNNGGQAEIVTNPQLRYDSVEDAVEKWDSILLDSDYQKELLEEQLESRPHLTTERFCREFDQLVCLCLERGVAGVVDGFRRGELGHFSKS